MKKTGLSFAAGFLTAVIILSIYSKISSVSSGTENTSGPQTGTESNPETLETPLSQAELFRSCPAFCESRPDRLDAPVFAKDLPAEFKSDFAGGVGLRWESVKNATKYRAIVFDRRGSERQQALTTKNNRMFFPNLPKAAVGETIELKVAVVAIDKNEMEGRMSEKRKLTITGTIPLVRAPKVKLIKVED